MLATRYTALSLLCATLGACAPQIDAYETGRIQALRNTGVVQENRQTLTVQVDAAGHVPEPDFRSTVDALTQLGDPATTHAVVGGATTQAAQTGTVRFLENLGVPRTNIVFTSAPTQGPGITLDLARFTVAPPECPAWDDLQMNYLSNAPSIPFGCATARNLHLMVEDPRDLLTGRPTGPQTGAREAKAVERYMEDKVKPLPSSSTGLSLGGN